ncbi:MAG: hypothetical protein K1X72_03000 [Pyrinomonadaceae bacterium]|nr:hypothetical protein [Pyrinomonadaceae bacterium]
MRLLKYGKGFIAFLIAFFIGISTFYFQFNKSESQSKILQTHQKIELSESNKVKCEAKSNQEIITKLYQERIELDVQMQMAKENPKELEIIKGKFNKINRIIGELENSVKKGNFKFEETNPNQKLIYLENCTKY